MTVDLAPLVHHLRRLAGSREPDADAVLLSRFVCRRDQAAFADLVARHGPLVLGVCRRVLGDVHAAEDAFQATFLVLARRAASLRRPAALAGWLHGVALRVARKARGAGGSRRLCQAPCDPEVPDPGPDPLEALTARELLTILHEEVQRLPEAYRLPVVMCCLEGLTTGEAACRLGWTPGSVKGRLERGRSRLHARLARRGLGLSAALAALEVSRGQAMAVPANLAMAAVRAALAAPGPGGVTATVAELANTATPGKLKLVAVLALAMGTVGLGARALTRSPGEQAPLPLTQAVGDEARPSATTTPQVHTDLYGDPLPPGALLRLGTLRHRHLHVLGTKTQALLDGKTALAATGDTVSWVDTTTGRVTDSWRLPRDSVVCGFSPDGRLALLLEQYRGPDGEVVFFSDRHRLRLWDLATRKAVRTLEGKGRLCTQVSAFFSPDSRTVAATISVNQIPGLLRVWDVGSGRQLWQEGALAAAAGCSVVGFRPGTGGLLLIHRLDTMANTVSLRETSSGHELRSFATLPPREPGFWLLSPDGNTLFVGTRGPAVRAWDVTTGKELPPLGGHREPAYSVAVSPDGKTVVTAGADPVVFVWDWPAGKVRRRLDLGKARGPMALAISADGRRVEVTPWGERVPTFFDLASGRQLPSTAEGHRSAVLGFGVAPDGRAVTGGTDNTLRVWDLRAGRQVRGIRTDHPVGNMFLALSGDGLLIATADINSGTVAVYERDTGRLLHKIDSGGRSVGDLSFARQGHLLALSGNRARAGFRDDRSEPFLAIFDADSGREVRRLEASLQATSGPLAWSPDGKLLAAVGTDQVWLWDTTTGRSRPAFRQGNAHVRALAFSPDGRALACGVGKGVTLWELASGQVRGRIEAAADYQDALQFTPDGRWLATAGAGAVHLCDVLRGQKVHSFAGHIADVTGVAFTRDGRLASSSYDTTVLVWDAASVTARQRRSEARPDATAVARAWDGLRSADAAAAYRAARLLTEAPGQSVPVLKAHLRPAPAVDAGEVARLLAALDSERFAERERAVRGLERLGDRAEAALRRFLAGGPSLEARRRAGTLLDRATGPVTDAEHLRALRAVEVLERIGTPEARQVLDGLAAGAPEARLTREARESLERLTARAGRRQ
jgi:RNA polymerase sigma factor (sigma-70 family)